MTSLQRFIGSDLKTGDLIFKSYVCRALAKEAYSVLSEVLEPAEPESKLIYFITQIVCLVSYGNLKSATSSELSSKFISLFMQLISLVSSMDLDRQPKPESELISLIKQIISLGNSVLDGWGHESQVVSLVTQMISLTSSIESDPEPEMMPLVPQIFYHLDSMHSDSKLLSLITQIFYLPYHKYIEVDPKIRPHIIEVLSFRDWNAKLLPYVTKIISRFKSDLLPESKLKSIITLLIFNTWPTELQADSKFAAYIPELISLVSSMDLDSQPKPESEFISLIKQIITLVNSTDLDSQQKPELNVMSLIKQIFSSTNSIYFFPWSSQLNQLTKKLSSLMLLEDFSHINSLNELERALMSLIHQISSLVISTDAKLKKRNSLRPQAQVIFEKGKFHVIEGKTSWRRNNKWECFPYKWEFCFPGDEYFILQRSKDCHNTKQLFTLFYCPTCNGENHKEYNTFPVEIKHPLHPKHYLQLVRVNTPHRTRVCYCCDIDLHQMFYYCSGCDYAMNIDCVEKPIILSIEHSKWHKEHTLALFPRSTSLNCNVCALTDSRCPIYMCPPCDFVVHQKCISLPKVIKISRHRHRIKFTSSFDRGDRGCGICRKKINNDYGGYSCDKKDCLYVAHTRCGTRSNVWDGIDLEGVLEEVEEEEKPPFKIIEEGIIEHFSHPDNHLKLDQNTGRVYDENKLCQLCIMPIYLGNLYSCIDIDCDFILHEKCANHPRKIEHPIHPHVLTLVDGATVKYLEKRCFVCPSLCTAGYFYICDKDSCHFTVHVGCGTISEPLDHPSHMHPLFLTSKPKEEEDGRLCSVCKKRWHEITHETFNCVEEECDFALCFGCATLPQQVRYKNDEHVLTLSYGEKTSTMTYWCEGCEGEIDPNERFYKCDEYCCVTLHTDCMLGADLYMKPNSLWLSNKYVSTLPNNGMVRPFCRNCRKRCPHKTCIKENWDIFCSVKCLTTKAYMYPKKTK